MHNFNIYQNIIIFKIYLIYLYLFTLKFNQNYFLLKHVFFYILNKNLTQFI